MATFRSSDLARGEYWRLITSTFVHFSLLHLGLNVLAMYQLGTMTESWFGKSQLVFIYGLTGGGGNLISAILRYAVARIRESIREGVRS